jgi:signal transduction histidine kinase/CHASE3 domain sensor protein
MNWMRKWPLRWRLFGIGGVVLVLMLGSVLVVLSDMQQGQALEQERTEALETVLTASNVLTAVLDMETGLRGYALSNREEFLQPYVQGRSRYDTDLRELEQAVGHDEAGLRHVQSMARLMDTWQEEVAGPEVDLARTGDQAGVDRVDSLGHGKALIDEVRAELGALVSGEQARADALAARAAVEASRARTTGLAAMLAAALVSTVLSRTMAASVLGPVGVLIDGIRAIEADGPGLQLPVGADDEIGTLARAVNQMSAVRKEQQEHMVSSQEELQAQQEELQAQNEELQAQHDQLIYLVNQLELEQHRWKKLVAFAGAAAESSDLRRLGERMLTGMLDATRSEVGAVILVRPGRPADVLASVGLTEEALASAGAAASGLAARALAERRQIAVSYPAGELLRPVYHTALPVQEELYVPILFGADALGIIALGRTAATPFDSETQTVAELLSAQAAAALSNALAFERLEMAYGNLDAVLGSTGEGIRLTDLTGAEVLVNNQFFRLLGVEPGSPIPEAAATVLQQDAPRSLQRTRTRLELTAPQKAVLALETEPALDRHGRHVGRVTVLRDVTQETEVDRMKTEFISTVSHELRTPLTAIRGYVDLILEGDAGEISAEQCDYLQVVRASSLRLGQLINDLLDVEKIEHGRVQFAREPVSLTQVVQEVAQTFRMLAAEKELTFAVRMPEKLPPVNGDHGRLVQVVSNLVSNAIKYTKSGGVAIEAYANQGDHVSITVRDTGIGIPREARSQLFNKFYRVDNQYTREVGGTGLGLAIARAIVREHGGEIEVASEIGQGSAFTVTLPAMAS